MKHLSALLLLTVSVAFSGNWHKHIHIYRGSTPTIDGILNEGEWDDAVLIEGVDGWNDQFIATPATNPEDLSVKCWIKHDGKNLYFAFDITDDVLYGIDTPRWTPDENPEKVHDLSKAGFPWFGDGIELLINASYSWSNEVGSFNYGDARSWQVVCNHSKSLLGGIGVGGLIQGEQRDCPNAWENHEKWIRNGDMKAITRVKDDKTGYIVEWLVSAKCLQVATDKEIFWSPELGIVPMGLNIGIQDLDHRDSAPENWGRFHHEPWWAGERDYRTEPRQWGTMFVHPDYNKSKDFFVSPNGKTDNPGTKEKPFACINDAKNHIRNLIEKEGINQDINVYIIGGTYNITEPLIFTPKDGGNKDYSITYAAYAGYEPVICGGKKITNWQKITENIWSASLPEVKSGEWEFRDLYKNGKRQTIARYPNEGEQYLHITEINEEQTRIKLPESIEKGDYSQSEIVVLHLWAASIARLKSIEADVAYAVNPVGIVGHGALDAQVGRKLYLQNSKMFLNSPGEYYLDTEAGTLFYYAGEGENPNNSTFTAPIAKKLLVINGQEDNPVMNLNFKGIRFQHTNWLLPQEGFSEAQSGHWGEVWDKTVFKGLPGAVELKHTESTIIENCKISSTGAHAIALGAAAKRNTVLGCEVYDVGGNGIMIGHRLKPCSGAVWFNVDWENPDHAPYRNRIINNRIEKFAQVQRSCVGVFDAYATGTSIAHNLIKDAPYTGISVGFNWGYKPTSQKETFVGYNEITEVMKMFYDGAGIYTLGLQPGTVISNNYIHNISTHGLYTDEGSQQILFERNIVNNVGDCAYQHHHGHSNIFRNNIFADARVNYIRRSKEDAEQSFWFDRNIFYLTGGRMLNGTWNNGLYKFTNNIYWNAKGAYPLQFLDMTHGWFGDWQNMGHDTEGVFANPLFGDAENGEFSMPANSPAIEAGFMPIYPENIGKKGGQ